MNELNSLDSLFATVDLGPLQPLLNELLGDVAEHLEVADFFESEEDDIVSYTLILGVRHSFLFPVPGFTDIQLGIVRDNEDAMPLILGELVIDGAPPRVSIRHFPLRVVIANPLLQAVVPEQNTTAVLAGFSFELQGALAVSADLAFHAELESFSLPPFTILGTGILLGLDECRLITRAGDVDDDILALGFDTGFRGFHAASAQFYWDIPFEIAGAELPGLRADFDNLALGNQGVSVAATLSWPVVHDGQRFDVAQTELFGALFGWEFALEQLALVVERNVPVGTSGIGDLRIPFLDRILRAELGYRSADDQGYRLNLVIDQAGGPPIDIALGHDSYGLQVSDLNIEGAFTTEGEFELEGQADIVLGLPGLNVTAESVRLAVEHLASHDALQITLEQVDIDGFGQLEQAQLITVFADGIDGSYGPQMLELVATLHWQDISARIHLSEDLPFLPLPPDDTEVTLRALWVGDEIQFTVDAALDDVDRLWRFVPEAARPQVADARIEIALAADGNDFSGELGLTLDLQLPDLATLAPLEAAGLANVVTLSTGDESDLIHLRFTAEIGDAPDGESTGRLTADVEDPLSLSLQLPGLTLPQPPVHIAITSIGVELSADGADVSGRLDFNGDFTLRPILPDAALGSAPPMIAQQLDRLLQLARQVDLTGTANLQLGISADNAWFETECTFEQAGLEIDLFDMLANTAGAGANLFSTEGDNEIDLDIDIAVELRRIYLSTGSPTPTEDDMPFRFGLATTLAFAGQSADLVFDLTHESLSFELDRLRIPIAIPKLPLNRSDLDRLRDASGQWDYANRWLTEIEPELDTQIDDENRLLDQAHALLEQYQADAADELAIFQIEFRTIPEIQKRLFDVVGRKFLYEAALAVYQMLGQLGVESSQSTYQQSMETYQDAVDVVFGSLHFDSRLQFEISDARFVLPFNDPSDIRVEGGASIVGFAPDDPLAPLSNLVFKLGLSADAIYFAVEGGAEPIPLPDFGRYPGSAVNLDRLVIGYGYSKNSLKIDFAGELIVSERLIDDADTSADLGFGVRLPENSKLQFKLDLIPIVLGEVDFVIPLVAFDIDLRSDTPPAQPPAGMCRPAWDGLQLHVPGSVRADLKRYAFSPFFGPLPAANYKYAYDLELGNDDLGLRHVADYRAIAPVAGTIPIPFLADAVPFFEHFCLDLRVAGFSLSFDLARPFPKPSPLLVFELLGFLSDPSVPIDPNGHIAGLMFAELYHGRISAPERVQALFPAANSVVGRDLQARVDVTTVIALYQQLQDLWERLQEQLAASTAAGADWVQELAANPPSFSTAALLRLLPEALRTLEVEGRFLHFEASAIFLLALASDIDAEYGDADQPAPPPPSGDAYELVYANDFRASALTGWKRYNHGLKKGNGNWRVAQGQLVQNNNVGDNSPGRYGAMLIYSAAEIDDLRLLVTVSSTDDDGMGVVFHVQNERTFYRFRMTEQQSEWRLDKLDDGRVTRLFSSEQSFVRNKRYDIRVETSSRAGASAGLSVRHSRSGTGRPAERLDIEKLVKAKQRQPLSITRIRVWVDGVVWCDVDDDRDALTHGFIGLDSWWNTGAHFDQLQLFARWQPVLSIGHALSADALTPLADTLSGQAGEPPAVLAAFSRQDIADAMADSPAVAVALAARVRLAGTQVFTMLGWMASDGRYRLLSRLNLSPLQLEVAGIQIRVPLQLEGRLALSGKSAGADSHVEVQGAVHADWTVLPGGPGKQPLARLIIGAPEDPVVLRLTSDREFALQGQSELQLFAEQVIVRGELDLSQAHALISGELIFAPDVFIGGARLLELQADVQGRIGPGRTFALQGAGELSLFGRAFAAGSVRIAERLIELTAEVGGTTRLGSWSPAGLPLKQIHLALAGRLDFRSSVPTLAMRGEGGFKLYDAQLEGNCRIETHGSDWLLAGAGRLFWQGRNWIDGSLVLSDDGIEISGHTDFGIRLTPTQLPAGIEIAGLHLRATVSGRFKLNAAGQLLNWAFDLDWQLAVRLPGTDGKQALPIATQQLKVSGNHAGTNDVMQLADLIAFNGLTLFDLDQFSVSVPTLDPSAGQAIYLRNGLEIDVDGDGGSVAFLTPVAPDDDATPVYEIPGIIGFYEDEVNIDLPGLSLPVPVLSTEAANAGDTPLLRVPGLGFEEVPLGRIRFDNTAFALKLAWQDGKLGVLVAGDDAFVPFDGNLFLGIVVAIGTLSRP